MQIKLSDWQNEVWHDNHRFRVIAAGRRSGKSMLSELTVITWASQHEGTYWIVCPTYKQAKQIHWDSIRKLIPAGLISKKNEVDLSITLTNGSLIELKGAETPDSLRGVKLRGLVIDEIASIRNWDWLWSEVLRPTLTDYEARAMFISSPKGFNHFHTLYELGQQEGSYKSWKFTSYDNPYVSASEIDSAKKELTEDTFQQEYMSDFTKFTGIAHTEWDREKHFIDEFDIPHHWQRARGFDYGIVHFTASIRMAVDDNDNWFIERSYLDNKNDVKGHAEAIKAQDYGFDFIPCFGDPSGKQWVDEFGMYGIHIQNADRTVGQEARGWVEFCVQKVNQRLKPVIGNTIELPDGRIIHNAPKLLVLNNGSNAKLVSQIENLQWKSTATGDIVPVLEETGDPTGGHYDLMAALRYLVVSYKPISTHTKQDFSNWQI